MTDEIRTAQVTVMDVLDVIEGIHSVRSYTGGKPSRDHALRSLDMFVLKLSYREVQSEGSGSWADGDALLIGSASDHQ